MAAGVTGLDFGYCAAVSILDLSNKDLWVRFFLEPYIVILDVGSLGPAKISSFLVISSLRSAVRFLGAPSPSLPQLLILAVRLYLPWAFHRLYLRIIR
jgi:hypothetical protein